MSKKSFFRNRCTLRAPTFLFYVQEPIFHPAWVLKLQLVSTYLFDENQVANFLWNLIFFCTFVFVYIIGSKKVRSHIFNFNITHYYFSKSLRHGVDQVISVLLLGSHARLPKQRIANTYDAQVVT